jgi:hypothetical protein
VLDSSDGLTWRHQPAGPAHPQLIAAGPRGIVVVSSIGEGHMTWFSVDGMKWTPSANRFPIPAHGDDYFEIRDVVATDARWVAVGSREQTCAFDCESSPLRAYVWTSVDGLEWKRIPDQAALERGGMHAVAQNPGGGYVAAGVSSLHAAAWTSPDAKTWSRVADTSLFHEPKFEGDARANAATGIAVHDGRIVMVGQAYAQDLCPESIATRFCGGARAWWSMDAATWARADMELARDSQVFSVAATPHGFLAVGPSGDPGCPGGIWSSSDGQAWRCETSDDPSYPKFAPYAAAASGSLEVAVGLTSEGVDEDSDEGFPGSIWVRARP